MQDVIVDTENAMIGLMGHIKRNINTLRVGSARADFLDTIQVEAYGQFMSIKQVATISVVDNFSLLVIPFDKSNNKAVTKAIQEANLGVSVVSEPTSIRVTMPKITEERRKEYVKILKQYAENGRISIRGARQDANKKITDAERSKEISEDNANRLKDQVQKLTDRFVKDIDKLSEEKEKEILKV